MPIRDGECGAKEEDCACPLVPPENWLEAPVRAGEKSYSLKSGEEGK